MKWNVFPNYKIPVEHVFYVKGQLYVEKIGCVSTPDVAMLKEDVRKNNLLIGVGINYEKYWKEKKEE